MIEMVVCTKNNYMNPLTACTYSDNLVNSTLYIGVVPSQLLLFIFRIVTDIQQTHISWGTVLDHSI